MTKTTIHALTATLSVLLLASCGGGSDGAGGLGPGELPGSGGVDFSGNFTMTVTASSVCSNIDPSLRHRSYPVNVTQAGDELRINVLGNADSATGLTGRVLDGQLYITGFVSEGLGDYVAQIAFWGLPSGGSLSGAFSGEIGSLHGSKCNAADHHLSFSPR